MSNLGAYQDFVVKASQSGGVDKLITALEKAAVSKVLPPVVAASLVVGTGIGIGAAAFWNRRKDQKTVADNIKRDLRQATQEPADSAGESDAASGELTN